MVLVGMRPWVAACRSSSRSSRQAPQHRHHKRSPMSPSSNDLITGGAAARSGAVPAGRVHAGGHSIGQGTMLTSIAAAAAATDGGATTSTGLRVGVSTCHKVDGQIRRLRPTARSCPALAAPAAGSRT